MPKGQQAPGQRTVTISIASDLVDQIDAHAAAETRTRSNWIVTELKKAVIARKGVGAKLHALPDAAHVDATPSDSNVSLRVAEDSPLKESPGPRARSTRAGLKKLVAQEKGKSPS